MEYEKLLYNPYLQFAMGLMAGNTGRTKGEAFSNAMQGGLTGINAAQRSQSYADQVKAQNEHYEMMKRAMENRKQIAAEMLKNPNVDEDRKVMWQMYPDSPEEAIRYFDTAQKARYNEAMAELKLNKLISSSGGSRGSGGGGLSESMPAGTRLPTPNAAINNAPVGDKPPIPQYLQGWRTDNKGNLYDRYGVKVSDDDKEFYREQMNFYNTGNYEAMSDFPQWKAAKAAKSDPNMMIYPKDFKNWIDMRTFQNVTKPMTQMEAHNNGYMYATDKQVSDLKSVKGSLDTLGEMQNMLFGNDGIYTKLEALSSPDAADKLLASGAIGIASKGFGAEQWQRNVRQFNDLRDSYLSQLSRMAGQVGTLTDRDVDLVRGMFPVLTPKWGQWIPSDAEEARQRFISIRNYVKSKGVDPDSILGNINIPSNTSNTRVKTMDQLESYLRSSGATDIKIGR